MLIALFFWEQFYILGTSEAAFPINIYSIYKKSGAENGKLSCNRTILWYTKCFELLIFTTTLVQMSKGFLLYLIDCIFFVMTHKIKCIRTKNLL